MTLCGQECWDYFEYNDLGPIGKRHLWPERKVWVCYEHAEMVKGAGIETFDGQGLNTPRRCQVEIDD